MKAYNCNKFPDGLDYPYAEISEIEKSELTKVDHFEEVYYWYAVGNYEGSGQLLGLLDGRWYIHDCGHCSCYGPLDHIELSENYGSLNELIDHCSKEYLKEISQLIEYAAANMMINETDYTGEMTKEIKKAYTWIRENNHTIPDDVLDLMKNAAIEKIIKGLAE